MARLRTHNRRRLRKHRMAVAKAAIGRIAERALQSYIGKPYTFELPEALAERMCREIRGRTFGLSDRRSTPKVGAPHYEFIIKEPKS